MEISRKFFFTSEPHLGFRVISLPPRSFLVLLVNVGCWVLFDKVIPCLHPWLSVYNWLLVSLSVSSTQLYVPYLPTQGTEPIPTWTPAGSFAKIPRTILVEEPRRNGGKDTELGMQHYTSSLNFLDLPNGDSRQQITRYLEELLRRLSLLTTLVNVLPILDFVLLSGCTCFYYAPFVASM